MLVGTKLTLTAKLGRKSEHLEKLLLKDVRHANEPYSHHEWVSYSEARMRNLKDGDIIKFTAIVTEYLGIGENGERALKKGLGHIRSIQRV